ncbi:MAG: GAF domain-containing protein [Ktedonobacteraceae bacterium]|nr:GAF domain-containing protein [Ktedonobacteraceae bacterium]
MRLTVRSLGGKLIIGAAVTLVLCMLLFSAFSLALLKYLSEHDAKRDASTHLTSIKLAYQAHNTTLTQELTTVASNSGLAPIIAQPLTPAASGHLAALLVPALARYHLAELDVISLNRQPLLQLGEAPADSNIRAPDMQPLIDQSLQGRAATIIRHMTLIDSAPSSGGIRWVLNTAIPIWNQANTVTGILVAAELIDDSFAQRLLRQAGMDTGLALCYSSQVLGSTIRALSPDKPISATASCTPGTTGFIDGAQHYLTQSSAVSLVSQPAGTPPLVLVDVEPLYSINAHTQRAALALLGLGGFLLALAITAYALVARIFFIRPFNQLQAQVTALVPLDPTPSPLPAASNELGALAQAFNRLAGTLHSQEIESQALAKQLSDLLSMSDALISSLNLEQLLVEIVSRLGNIMDVKQVSLLLYGRDMLTPWALAQWIDLPAEAQTTTSAQAMQHGTTITHIDPGGDVAMMATTKLAAIPNVRANTSGTKRPGTIRAPKLKASGRPSGAQQSRIPQQALHDLDMLLARMAMQKQKIAYGEDINAIHQDRHENWTRMALEAGHRSAIAVPLLLQDQPIGAFMLYSDRPRQMTQHNTFLLSTAANQAAMAIQDALLFSEVKEKNAALERVNQLKSQFLATVTHELRTPLHSIISYGSLILEGFVDGELTPEQEEHIQFMVRRAEDLSHLVDDMLNLSKIEADRIEIKIEPLALEPCLAEVVNQLKPMANTKNLHLTLETGGTVPMVLADSHRIRQIVINMVSNALKFTEKGGVTIRCDLLEHYDLLRVAVHDTGVGISPAALEYIFEAFRQADGSTTRRFGGTGLGLTIARRLIELQGGEVTVESVPGQGSIFSFTLPIVPVASHVRS